MVELFGVKGQAMCFLWLQGWLFCSFFLLWLFMVFCRGFGGKWVVERSCFDGEFVVECVVKLVSRQSLFEPRKMGQGLWIYF
jgi:hypothetical protein